MRKAYFIAFLVALAATVANLVVVVASKPEPITYGAIAFCGFFALFDLIMFLSSDD